jgi:hypothetical protein
VRPAAGRGGPARFPAATVDAVPHPYAGESLTAAIAGSAASWPSPCFSGARQSPARASAHALL